MEIRDTVYKETGGTLYMDGKAFCVADVRKYLPNIRKIAQNVSVGLFVIGSLSFQEACATHFSKDLLILQLSKNGGWELPEMSLGGLGLNLGHG